MACRFIGLIKEVKTFTHSTGDVVATVKFEFPSRPYQEVLTELHRFHDQEHSPIVVYVMNEIEDEEAKKK